MVLRKKFLFRVIPVLIVFFLSGSFARGSLAMTVEEEKKLGKTILLQIERQGGLVNDPTIYVFINRIGYSIVRELGFTPFDFRFYVVKADDPNAFAVPGGYIFVTTGLIVLAENEQEIAGVLGHEISHVTGRHLDKMMDKAKRLSLVTLAGMILGALAGRGGAGTGAAVATGMATGETLALKYSREYETDADQNGLYRMVKAGYDPNGLISFFNRLYRISLTAGPKVPTYLLNHPGIEDRIVLLENLLRAMPKPEGPFKKVGNFKRVQAKVFVEEREPDLAVKYFGSIVNANPQGVDGIYGLGLALKKMGRLDKSTEVFQTGLSLSPKDPDLLRELGIVYFLSGKVDPAIENLEASRSVSMPDQDPDLLTLYYLGRAYQEKEDLTNALPLFLKVQKEMPDFVDAYLNLGSVYGRMGQKGLSHFYFGKHFKMRGDGRNALLHFKTALEWLEKGSPEREEAQQEIKELTPHK